MGTVSNKTLSITVRRCPELSILSLRAQGRRLAELPVLDHQLMSVLPSKVVAGQLWRRATRKHVQVPGRRVSATAPQLCQGAVRPAQAGGRAGLPRASPQPRWAPGLGRRASPPAAPSAVHLVACFLTRWFSRLEFPNDTDAPGLGTTLEPRCPKLPFRSLLRGHSL